MHVLRDTESILPMSLVHAFVPCCCFPLTLSLHSSLEDYPGSQRKICTLEKKLTR